MTLTRILPSLRRSIPDPLAIDHWPVDSVATTTDLLVGDVSMRRLAEVCRTPAVHVARAVEPGTGGLVASTTAHTGVVVVRVVEASADRMVRTLSIDADLSALQPSWNEARLLGRASVTRVTPTEIMAAANGCLAPAIVDLPADLGAGDLLALPYSAVAADAGSARPTSGWNAPSFTTARASSSTSSSSR